MKHIYMLLVLMLSGCQVSGSKVEIATEVCAGMDSKIMWVDVDRFQCQNGERVVYGAVRKSLYEYKEPK